MAKHKVDQMVTDTIRSIAMEETEFILNDPKNPNSGKRMGTKVEALGRKIWQLALGYTTTKKCKDGTKTITEHKPDKWAMGMIADRMDGRAVPAAIKASANAGVASRVSEQSKKIINGIADGATEA